MNLTALMTEFLVLTTVVTLACAPALLQRLRARAGSSYGA